MLIIICCRRNIFVQIPRIREPLLSNAAKDELEQQSVRHSRDLFCQFTDKSEVIVV